MRWLALGVSGLSLWGLWSSVQGYVLLVALGSLIMDEVFAVREAVITAQAGLNVKKSQPGIPRMCQTGPSLVQLEGLLA